MRMIERVARAIGSVESWDGDALDQTITRDELHAAAKAAIEAMREPTPATIDAMKANIGPLSEMWRAGIDAALSEKLK